MLRKDVKLGFAIGGVLLAVLVVYVLVGTGGEKTPAPPAGTVNVATDANSTDPSKTVDVAAAPGSDALASADKSDDSIKAQHDAVKESKADPNKDLWGTALNEGHLMLTETPDANASHPNNTKTPTDIPGGGTRDNGTPAAPARANVPADPMLPEGGDSGPSTQPSHSAGDSPAGYAQQRTHIVQKGETLAKISQMAYGSASYYPAILRANSSLDPKKLKPGMSIVLPAISDVKPDARTHAAAGENGGTSLAAPALDAKSQYRVESGDTLERIALKLYGKREMKDKIYELNKDSIGADPNKLKLHQLLKLPSQPTNNAPASSGQ